MKKRVEGRREGFMKEKKSRTKEQEYLRRNEKKGGGKERGLHEVEKKESRGAIIFEQGSTHVLPGSHVSKNRNQ